MLPDFVVPFGVGVLATGVSCYLFGSGLYHGLRQQCADAQIALRSQMEQLERRYVEILRREIGTLLIDQQPDTLATAYDELMAYEETIGSSKNTESARLSEQYKKLVDFDMINTRHFIPYAEAFESYSAQEILNHYQDISKWLIATNDSSISVTSNRERSLLRDTITSQRNVRVREQASLAMRLYFGRKDCQSLSYEDAYYKIRRLPPTTPDTEYAIELKQSNEFAVYALFIDDADNRFESIYRSDSSFERRETTLG